MKTASNQRFLLPVFRKTPLVCGVLLAAFAHGVGCSAPRTGAGTDKNGDRVIDSLGVTFDKDGDGQPDTFDFGGRTSPGVGVDTNGDGVLDAIAHDTDGDGIYDALDTDGDGRPDRFANTDPGGGWSDDDLDLNPGGPDGAQCNIQNGQQVCVCITVATFGGLGTFGAVPGQDGTDAISAWLNANSTGEAAYFASKPAITKEFLDQYDVVILQDLSGWPAFSADEKATFEAWVRAGGGVISLNGYSANGNEMANVNDLLAFTGLAYVANSDTANETQRASKLGVCEDCYGASVPQAGWTSHPIGLNMKQVGAFHGRAVTGGTPVCEEFGAVLGATAELDAGHVFMFHDEWVTYNSQWTGAGLVTDCRDPQKSAFGQCEMQHPLVTYSNAQFWYNSLLWASGDVSCFDIRDGSIIK